MLAVETDQSREQPTDRGEGDLPPNTETIVPQNSAPGPVRELAPVFPVPDACSPTVWLMPDGSLKLMACQTDGWPEPQ